MFHLIKISSHVQLFSLSSVLCGHVSKTKESIDSLQKSLVCAVSTTRSQQQQWLLQFPGAVRVANRKSWTRCSEQIMFLLMNSILLSCNFSPSLYPKEVESQATLHWSCQDFHFKLICLIETVILFLLASTTITTNCSKFSESTER